MNRGHGIPPADDDAENDEDDDIFRAVDLEQLAERNLECGGAGAATVPRAPLCTAVPVAPSAEDLRVLRERFGHRSFKPEQWEMISSAGGMPPLAFASIRIFECACNCGIMLTFAFSIGTDTSVIAASLHWVLCTSFFAQTRIRCGKTFAGHHFLLW